MGPRKISVLFHFCFESFTKFCETLKTRVKLNTNFTCPHAITYTSLDSSSVNQFSTFCNNQSPIPGSSD